MSALPLKADMLSVSIDVRFVPIADIGLHQHWVPMAGVFAHQNALSFTPGGISLKIRSRSVQDC